MKTKAHLLVVLMIFSLFAAGCTYLQPTEETPSEDEGITFVPIEDIPTEEEPPAEDITGEITEEIEEIIEEEPPAVPEKPVTKAGTIEIIEGELVKLALKATDADGDKLIYKFSAPLNDKGEWQTAEGDAGEYEATVTVSDGKAETSKDILIIVKTKNQVPILETIEDVTVNEGDTISFSPKATDPDGDKVTISYSGWMSSASYKTSFEDAGNYKVKITASDGKDSVSQEVKITVKNVNRAPILQSISDMSIKEGEKVTINAIAADPDKDNVVITYSAPLDENGEWETKEGDAGKHRVTVTASDGNLEAERSFFIVVEALNKAPVIENIKITVTPSDGVEIAGLDVAMTLTDEDDERKITLEPNVKDADGDEITVSYSGYMTKNTKTITWDDGGSKTVTVTATDGKTPVSKNINLEINRAPQFEI